MNWFDIVFGSFDLLTSSSGNGKRKSDKVFSFMNIIFLIGVVIMGYILYLNGESWDFSNMWCFLSGAVIAILLILILNKTGLLHSLKIGNLFHLFFITALFFALLSLVVWNIFGFST